MQNKNQLIFRYYIHTCDKIHLNKNKSENYSRETNSFEKNPVEISKNKLTLIFTNIHSTGYCCCSKTNYKLTFLKEKDTLDYFYIDTGSTKNRITIFEKSYQHSFQIDKKNWEEFLNSH